MSSLSVSSIESASEVAAGLAAIDHGCGAEHRCGRE